MICLAPYTTLASYTPYIFADDIKCAIVVDNSSDFTPLQSNLDNKSIPGVLYLESTIS